jgi:hypothetical protein
MFNQCEVLLSFCPGHEKNLNISISCLKPSFHLDFEVKKVNNESNFMLMGELHVGKGISK